MSVEESPLLKEFKTFLQATLVAFGSDGALFSLVNQKFSEDWEGSPSLKEYADKLGFGPKGVMKLMESIPDQVTIVMKPNGEVILKPVPMKETLDNLAKIDATNRELNTERMRRLHHQRPPPDVVAAQMAGLMPNWPPSLASQPLATMFFPGRRTASVGQQPPPPSKKVNANLIPLGPRRLPTCSSTNNIVNTDVGAQGGPLMMSQPKPPLPRLMTFFGPRQHAAVRNDFGDAVVQPPQQQTTVVPSSSAQSVPMSPSQQQKNKNSPQKSAVNDAGQKQQQKQTRRVNFGQGIRYLEMEALKRAESDAYYEEDFRASASPRSASPEPKHHDVFKSKSMEQMVLKEQNVVENNNKKDETPPTVKMETKLSADEQHELVSDANRPVAQEMKIKVDEKIFDNVGDYDEVEDAEVEDAESDWDFLDEDLDHDDWLEEDDNKECDDFLNKFERKYSTPVSGDIYRLVHLFRQNGGSFSNMDTLNKAYLDTYRTSLVSKERNRLLGAPTATRIAKDSFSKAAYPGLFRVSERKSSCYGVTLLPSLTDTSVFWSTKVSPDNDALFVPSASPLAIMPSCPPSTSASIKESLTPSPVQAMDTTAQKSVKQPECVDVQLAPFSGMDTVLNDYAVLLDSLREPPLSPPYIVDQIVRQDGIQHVVVKHLDTQNDHYVKMETIYSFPNELLKSNSTLAGMSRPFKMADHPGIAVTCFVVPTEKQQIHCFNAADKEENAIKPLCAILCKMAKWGEGDPRWIVEERPDATNVNNWHWVEKNATPWSQERLKGLLLNQSLEKGSIRIVFSDFKKLEGEATANNRKAKLIFFFEWTIDVNFIATICGSEIEYKGNVEIHNLSDENEAQEIEISTHVDTPGPHDNEIRHILSIDGLAFVRSQMASYVRELKEEFSKGIILPVDSKGAIRPQANDVVRQSKAKTEPIEEQKSLKTVGFELVETFKVPPDRLFEILTESQFVTAWSPNSSIDAREGGEFSLLGGVILGHFTNLAKDAQIAMAWRLKSYPPGHYAAVKFVLKDKGDSTNLELSADGVPEHLLEDTKTGFSRYYFQCIGKNKSLRFITFDHTNNRECAILPPPAPALFFYTPSLLAAPLIFMSGRARLGRQKRRMGAEANEREWILARRRPRARQMRGGGRARHSPSIHPAFHNQLEFQPEGNLSSTKCFTTERATANEQKQLRNNAGHWSPFGLLDDGKMIPPAACPSAAVEQSTGTPSANAQSNACAELAIVVSTAAEQQRHLPPPPALPPPSSSSASVSSANLLQCSLSQSSIHESAIGALRANSAIPPSSSGNGQLAQSEWHPASAQLCAYHDCRSLAYAWGLGTSTSSLETTRPTGASQAQSPSEDDPGDGKCNDLLANCPAFRNELGDEPIRRIALSRHTFSGQSQHIQQQQRINGRKRSPPEEAAETWHREHMASEDVSNVYLGGRLCASRQPRVVVEPLDLGSYYYRHCFAGRNHVEYVGMDESSGPICVSMVREESKDGTSTLHAIYRLILRVSDVLTMRVSVPDEALSDAANQDRSTRTLMRELLEVVCPQVHFGCLRPALSVPKVEELLLKIDEQPIYTRYKVGVLYCKAGQSTEEQMYNNEHSSPHFEEFLDFLGTRVRLRGFESYKGGLDTRGDTTGLYSIYTEHHSAQIMFHVSTMLPFTPNNKQQLYRKRHIGNDMVTIIFQEPDALPFSPITVRSHFQHVFIVVRACNPLTEGVTYRVAVSRAKDVPAFGSPVPASATFQKSAEFHDFLITKIINAENAVHRSRKFASMAARTRREALKDLLENYAGAAHSNEGASRIASRLLGGSVKRKERVVPKPVLDAAVRAAISWQVDVFDHSSGQRTPAVLGLSVDTLVLLSVPSGLAVFSTPTHSILGWIQAADGGVKIFFDHGDLLLLWCASPDGSERELVLLLKRLAAVTNGEEAKEVILHKNKAQAESFGFHVQEEGIVTDVDMNKSAWRVGLRQGSRIVELENAAFFTFSQEHIAILLVERSQIKVTMIAPASDGNPRRGCEDPNCPAVRGLECQQLLTPDSFARQPLAYQQMFALRDQQRRGDVKLSSNSSSESWGNSTPPPMSLMAVTERKKFSAPTFGSVANRAHPLETNSSVDSIQSRLNHRPQHTSFTGPSHPQKSQVSSSSAFGRARSDDVTTKPPVPPVSPKSSLQTTPVCGGNSEGVDRAQQNQRRRVSTDGELSRYQWCLQKTVAEKRELEAELEQYRAQLQAEQRAHESTRRQLQMIMEYCERFSIIPPPFEEEDEEL
uniref:Rap-GAP domain-containing protein n=1 Tax=Globodera rostochiensis TaxID=31243 RepID=A0A914HJB0_GLORO